MTHVQHNQQLRELLELVVPLGTRLQEEALIHVDPEGMHERTQVDLEVLRNNAGAGGLRAFEASIEDCMQRELHETRLEACEELRMASVHSERTLCIFAALEEEE